MLPIYKLMKRILIIISFVFLASCASTPKGVVTDAAPAQSTAPAPVPAPVPVQDVPPEPEKPAISPELEALNQAVAGGSEEEIEAASRAIIDRDPLGQDAVHAYCALAELELQRQPDTARLYIERAAEIAPANAVVQLTMGRIAHAQQLDDEALRHFNSSAQADPASAAACIEAAAILIRYLDIANALTQAKCAYERAPQDCAAMTIYADALYANKQFEEAAATYELRQTASCPASEDALRNLAKLYETHLSNPKRACQVYTELSTLRPEDPNYSASRDYQCSL